jgi:hypothetical protein
MKKFIQIFAISTSILFYSSNAFAARVITTSYHKSCIIGCGSVDITRTPSTLTHADGTTESVVLRTVNCTGVGFNSCPAMAPIGTNPDWVEAANEVLFGHAVNEINNGINSGTHSQTFLNVDTGKMITLYVDWVITFNEIGEKVEEKIEVYYLN